MQAKQNLELKHFCADFVSVRRVLKQFGATKEVVKKQKDFFFDLPRSKQQHSARLKFRIENSHMELVYYERPPFRKGEETTSENAILDSDKRTLEFLKKALGVIGVVEKKREVWRNGHTVFHLDDVKGVGKIFEIELQKVGSISKKDRELFSEYQKNVLPYLGKVITGSNIDLVSKV